MKSQQSRDASLLELEEKVGQLTRKVEDIAKQSFNSHHDLNLDIAKLSEFDTSYTCYPNMCVEIYFSMLLASISFAGINPYPNTPEVHMIAQDKEDFDDTCAACGEMNKCIAFDDMIYTADVGFTTPTPSNESECIDATIPIVFYADQVDSHVVKISRPLPVDVQPPLMEEKSLLNQETLNIIPPQPINLHFIPSPIPTRPYT